MRERRRLGDVGRSATLTAQWKTHGRHGTKNHKRSPRTYRKRLKSSRLPALLGFYVESLAPAVLFFR